MCRMIPILLPLQLAMFSGPDKYLEYSHWMHKKIFKSIRKKSFHSKSAKTKNCHGGLDTDFLTFLGEFFYVLVFIFRSTRHTFIIFLLEETCTYG